MDSSRRYFVTNLHPTYLFAQVTFYCLVSCRFLLSLSVTKLRHCHGMVACGYTEIEMPYIHVVEEKHHNRFRLFLEDRFLSKKRESPDSRTTGYTAVQNKAVS